MKVEGIQFEINDGAIEVKHPQWQGRYFVTESGWTWVKNVLGSDTVDYEVGSDQIVLVSHSTHNTDYDGKRTVIPAGDEDYERLMHQHSELLSLRNNS